MNEIVCKRNKSRWKQQEVDGSPKMMEGER